MADILAMAAHPDDIELSASGTLLKAHDAGQSIALCDLTEGERGTRGSREERRRETERANRVLGITAAERWNLRIPDGNIALNDENILKAVQAIRYFRPRVLVFSWEHDRHPDHDACHQLVRRACFDAGLTMVRTEYDGEPQQPHRPERMYCFFHTYERIPDFIVDISDQIERKLAAVAAYSSQFTVPGFESDTARNEPRTFISEASYMESLLGRMRHWGFMIGARYGEAFTTVSGPLKVNDLLGTI
ncbi:MAG TPA: bacillithiol biosynthesis deacetylase BshB1 [Candidatus Kapabacteria bacterium]|nr:bacillithiol biosynthesis deacetylase BshB1 [Candidatus Kapabacteria bacterium]